MLKIQSNTHQELVAHINDSVFIVSNGSNKYSIFGIPIYNKVWDDQVTNSITTGNKRIGLKNE